MCILTDPPDVNLINTHPPAIEFLSRELECDATGGNPSSGYTYTWMYIPKYSSSPTNDFEPVKGGYICNIMSGFSERNPSQEVIINVIRSRHAKGNIFYLLE